MGRKERLRKVRQKKIIDKVSKIDNLKNQFSSEILRLRQEISSRNSKLSETLVRLVSELSALKTDVSVLMKALISNKIITKENLNEAHQEMKDKISKMFDANGKMKGTTIVTCYNADDLNVKESDEYQLVKINTISKE